MRNLKKKHEKSNKIAKIGDQYICMLLFFSLDKYRVPLPYARIDQLNNDAISMETKIGIFTHSNERTQLLINELINLTAKYGKYCTHIFS